jgi:hypothetical protein
MTNSYYKKLYLVSGLYDFLLGVGFLFFYPYLFKITGMNIPENPSYLTFCAFMIMVFGILLFMISSNLEGSRRLVIYAIFVKFSYIATVLYYYFAVGTQYVDPPFLLFAGFDFVFALLFIESLRVIKK